MESNKLPRKSTTDPRSNWTCKSRSGSPRYFLTPEFLLFVYESSRTRFSSSLQHQSSSIQIWVPPYYPLIPSWLELMTFEPRCKAGDQWTYDRLHAISLGSIHRPFLSFSQRFVWWTPNQYHHWKKIQVLADLNRSAQAGHHGHQSQC